MLLGHPKPLISMATRYRGQTIALYGGSFNPAHDGHLHVAQHALKALKASEVWMMVSPGNPLKDGSDMESFEKRYAGVEEMTEGHTGIYPCDVEKRIGTRYSADTLAALMRHMPHTRFVWVMGADNLHNFDQWMDWQDIANTVPIAIFDRPGYAISGLYGTFARVYAKQRIKSGRSGRCRLGAMKAPAWTFLAIPRHKAAATHIRQMLRKSGEQ